MDLKGAFGEVGGDRLGVRSSTTCHPWAMVAPACLVSRQDPALTLPVLTELFLKSP